MQGDLREPAASLASVSLAATDRDAEKSTPADPAVLAELPPELNPRNWTRRRKWINVGLIAFQATLSPISSTLLAVGQFQVDTDLHVTSSFMSAMPVATYVLGLGLGPLYLAPLSEMYGRRRAYLVNCAAFTLINIACAVVRSDSGLVVLRLFVGLAGSAGPALGGGTIGDMFIPEERGGAQAIYGFGPTFGPAIGGLVGGYIADRAGWRWSMWVTAIASGATTLASLLLLRETYAPYILARLRGQRSAGASAGGFVHAFTRPLRMLLFSPIAIVMSLYMALIYGLMYLQLVTIPLLFDATPLYDLFTYGWPDGHVGLAYLSAAVGCLLSLATCIMTLNRSYRALCKKYGEKKPEYRMPFMQIGMLIIPVGLFMYGWTAQAQTHFILPLIGATIFAFGALIAYTCIQTYLVDTFGKYAASALAACVLVRSIGGALFSIFGANLYQSLGYGWGSSVLAFICIGALPLPTILWFYGSSLRARAFVF
ncbi:MFS general substrate transporter [Obba rivulosa]|uniref:MFS general substrate transporter n=1 Tax=Obba rivulosa TaxID=1052685 RepID=A0A8E2B4P5_9APHY|nr:MFS general substrate transporter [Obba rivulosa]